MNIIISHKFLLFVAAFSLAVSVPLTEAARKQFIRGTVEKEDEQKSRRLKSGKNSFGPNSFSQTMTTPAITTNVVTTPNSVVVSGVAATPTGNTVKAWEGRCVGKSRQLDNCVGGDDRLKNACKQCVVGKVGLTNPTYDNLIACNRIPQPNRLNSFCGSGCKVQVIDFYNCGAGKNLSLTSNALKPALTVTAGSLSNTVVTGPSGSTSAVSGMYAPTRFCPFTEPNAGDIGCTTNGFEFKKCFYPGKKLCSCRKDDITKTWNCVIN